MASDEIREVAELDDLFHAKARLGIMTIITTRGETDFATLKQQLGLTDGNLGAHLRALEAAGYLEFDKAFVDRKPRTTYEATSTGRRAFQRYLDQLERVIHAARANKKQKPRDVDD